MIINMNYWTVPIECFQASDFFFIFSFGFGRLGVLRGHFLDSWAVKSHILHCFLIAILPLTRMCLKSRDFYARYFLIPQST